MDIRTRTSIRLEGEGFDLLPELKQFYLANGRCLRKALSYTDEQHINRVVFVDCTQKPEPCVSSTRKPSTAYIAIVNHLDTQIEIELLRTGFHGQLIRNSSLVLQLTAIDFLVKGEMYFSRKALSQYVYEIYNKKTQNSERMALNVTLKERQIVDCIFKGLSNQEIANALNISLNTVKMHLQNIYRKNNLKGRIQLMSSY
ncbi:response regulator transcription factor [Shewanella algidipiscicola]|uniref:response regulator transcription factor n=1 Tax=Shewanella algidipiscicola TaxID=614070 RepID=UPI000D788A84|nr:response regulator transcription factor [Shewanella algidipiscicola]